MDNSDEDISSTERDLTVLDSWTFDEQRELIDLYIRQMSFASLAEYFDRSKQRVVERLAILMLSAQPPLVNKLAKNFGQPWTEIEVERLIEKFQRGLGLSAIAEALERDELGVSFQILSRCPVVVPNETKSLLELDEYWSNENDPELQYPPMRTCPVCLDVILYCACRFQDWIDP